MPTGKSWLRVVAVAAAVAVVAGGAEAGDAERGKAKAVDCIACHGATGVGTREEIPNLAGQHEQYLAVQIKAFRRTQEGENRSGEPTYRYDAVMGHQATGLTDAGAEDLAAYYASRPCVPEKLEKGQPTVDMAKQCAECHGAFGRSTNPLVPRLAGQHQTYLENQLKAVRGSGRGQPAAGIVHRLRVHPVMGPRGLMLNDTDIAELAAYFAGLSCR